MPQRSFTWIKSRAAEENRRPIFWISLLSVLLLLIQESGSRFGAMTTDQGRGLIFGFSPELPGRTFGLPWIFSGLVHLSWVHLLKNLFFLFFLYFFARKKLNAKNWWMIIGLLQISLNLYLFLFAFLAESPVKAPEQKNLYFGLSGICFGLVGFFYFFRGYFLRILASICLAYLSWESFWQTSVTDPFHAHLAALVFGFLFGFIYLRWQASLLDEPDLRQNR